MTAWSLSTLLAELNATIEEGLARSRRAMGHPVAKGDASESVWLSLLSKYLPERYQAARAYVVDSHGTFSHQLDIVIYDRQYSPLIFEHEGQTIIPAESVYAIFEAKQSVDAEQVAYAQKKIGSVRRLHRTSLPVPNVLGVAEPKPLHSIIGGLLAFESDWKPKMGAPLADALRLASPEDRLDIGCIAAAGIYSCDADGKVEIVDGQMPATGFLLELIARLQSLGTVPMLDTRAYAAWLAEPDKAV